MRKGVVYLSLEPEGANALRVVATRRRKPQVQGVWVKLHLSAPDSVFKPYLATLELREENLTVIEAELEYE